MTDPRIVVGLGNPGPEYAAHRHNVGFRVVEQVARRRGLELTAAVGGVCAVTADPADGLILVEPRTYMNRSGAALAAWARAAGLDVVGAAPDPETAAPPSGVRPLVVCDDLALPLGSLRLRRRGSSGGQKGLASLIDELGGEEFPRLRLGIAPLAGNVAPEDWPDFVLEPFAADEREAAAALVRRAADAVAHWAEHGIEDTIARFNRRIRPEENA